MVGKWSLIYNSAFMHYLNILFILYTYFFFSVQKSEEKRRNMDNYLYNRNRYLLQLAETSVLAENQTQNLLLSKFMLNLLSHAGR